MARSTRSTIPGNRNRFWQALPIGLLLCSAALADSHTQAQHRPIQMGTSGGNAADETRSFCCGGTLGALVLIDGRPQILSNNHILARADRARPGEAIVQPGLIDAGCSVQDTRQVAVFNRDWVPLGTANVDAAAARALRGRVDRSGAILGLGVPCSDPAGAGVGMAVVKSARTTGVTSGTIQAVDMRTAVDYQPRCNAGPTFTIFYDNQIAISPGSFSDAGDSGALVLSTGLHPVGLLYAGTSDVTVANPIGDVISAFEAGGDSFEFVGNACAQAAAQLAGPPAADVEAARAVKAKRAANLMAVPGVLAVGVGKVDDAPSTREVALVVYVERGRAKSAAALPGVVDGVKVRVIETDRFRAR
jgi:hypothetical protein